MRRDCRDLEITAASAAAVTAFDATVAAYAGLRRDTGRALEATLAADPLMPMGQILRGYFMLLFSRREFLGRADDALAKAAAAIEAAGATPRERQHLSALAAWRAGRLEQAVRIWESILIEHPRDFVALKLAQYGTFYEGDSRGMRASTSRVLHAWDESVPGYGFVLGCHAFGLEESGDYRAAEDAGRRAVALNPADVWAAHAVAHVLEMQNRTREGIAWIDGLDSGWSEVNNFAFHIRWHRCLFHLEREDYARVLELYDKDVRPEPTDEYLDISNGVALLWRLEQAGIDVGARWHELRERSAGRLGDRLLVFAEVHYAMALASDPAARFAEWSAQSEAWSREGESGQAKVMAELGLALAEAARAHRRGEAARVVELLLPRRRELHRLGGSHAQRDLFEQMLIDAALAAGDRALTRALLSERLQQRPDNLWGWRQLARAAALMADARMAASAAQALQRLRAA